MEFFKGLLSVLILYAVCGSMIYFAKEFGIKRGRDLASKELSHKLRQCNRILIGETK
jgi:hypothetical protein